MLKCSVLIARGGLERQGFAFASEIPGHDEFAATLECHELVDGRPA